jgi:hypothetical protein
VKKLWMGCWPRSVGQNQVKISVDGLVATDW